MKKFKSFVKYKPLIAGFINKKVDHDSTNQPQDRDRDDYVDMFAGFINKPAKIFKKIIKEDEDIAKTNANIDKLHYKLSKHYASLKHDFAHEKAIKYYTMTGHQELNRSLHEDGGRSLSSHKKSYDKYLSSALKTKKTPHKIEVHTGLKSSPMQFKGRKTGKSLKVRLPAYTSTSIKKDVAESFAAHQDSYGNKNQNHVFTHKTSTGDLQSVPNHILKLHNNLKKKIGYSTWSPESRQKVHQENQPHFDKLAKAVKKHTGMDLHTAGYGDRIKQKTDHDDFNGPKLGNHETSIKNVGSYAHVVTLHVPRGSHGAYVGEMSPHITEKEFLLHKGARMHLNAKPEYNHEKRTINWTGRLVHDGVKPLE